MIDFSIALLHVTWASTVAAGGWLKSLLPQSVLVASLLYGPLLKGIFLRACSAVESTSSWSFSSAGSETNAGRLTEALATKFSRMLDAQP